MSESERDGAAVRIPPPLVYLGALLVGWLLQMVLPIPFELAPAARIGVGVLAALLGILMMYLAIVHFKRTGQATEPWKSTPEIISSGLYRVSRNPMYVGMALLQLAIGVGAANGWIVILIPPVLYIVYATAIRHEEQYLEQKFGSIYIEYKTTVRRWL